MKKKEFMFEGKHYEIRSWLLDDFCTYKVKVFLNNEPVNGYHYTVGIEDINDTKSLKFPQDLLKELMELAENDIKEKKWKKYLETFVE